MGNHGGRRTARVEKVENEARATRLRSQQGGGIGQSALAGIKARISAESWSITYPASPPHRFVESSSDVLEYDRKSGLNAMETRER